VSLFVIDAEHVSEPAAGVVRRPHCACRACEGGVVQAPAPERPIDGGMATEALIARVVVSKFCDSIPPSLPKISSKPAQIRQWAATFPPDGRSTAAYWRITRRIVQVARGARSGDPASRSMSCTPLGTRAGGCSDLKLLLLRALSSGARWQQHSLSRRQSRSWLLQPCLVPWPQFAYRGWRGLMPPELHPCAPPGPFAFVIVGVLTFVCPILSPQNPAFRADGFILQIEEESPAVVFAVIHGWDPGSLPHLVERAVIHDVEPDRPRSRDAPENKHVSPSCRNYRPAGIMTVMPLAELSSLVWRPHRSSRTARPPAHRGDACAGQSFRRVFRPVR
jgi:hypothetical protein